MPQSKKRTKKVKTVPIEDVVDPNHTRYLFYGIFYIVWGVVFGGYLLRMGLGR